jgi:hypothetical protein
MDRTAVLMGTLVREWSPLPARCYAPRWCYPGDRWRIDVRKAHIWD